MDGRRLPDTSAEVQFSSSRRVPYRLIVKELTVHALFWLVFKEQKEVFVIIQPAGDIITARMRAMLSGIEGEFQEGYELAPKMAKKVPKSQIGKMLSRAQATALLKKLDK